MAELGSHQIDVTNWYLGAHPSSVVGMGGIDFWKDGREVNDNVQVCYEYPSGAKLTYQSIEMNEFDGYAEQFMGRKGTLITSEDANTKSTMFRERGEEDFEFGKFSQNKTQVGKKQGIVLDAGATTKQDKRSSTSGQSLGTTDTGGKDNWYLSLEDWIDCIRTGRKPYCDGRIGMSDVACILAANEAMDTGRRVKITDEMLKV